MKLSFDTFCHWKLRARATSPARLTPPHLHFAWLAPLGLAMLGACAQPASLTADQNDRMDQAMVKVEADQKRADEAAVANQSLAVRAREAERAAEGLDRPGAAAVHDPDQPEAPIGSQVTPRATGIRVTID